MSHTSGNMAWRSCFTRLAVCILLLVTAATLDGCSSGEDAGGNARKPDVILVTVDTLRADYLGCYGKQDAATPFIDGLAAKGALFERAFCEFPSTGPSHASIFTSQYPRSHNVLCNLQVLEERYVTLAEILKNSGYNTSAFVTSWILDPKYGFGQGFDNYTIIPDHKHINEIENWLSARNDKKTPFFMWIHLFAPHKPYTPPKSFAPKSDNYKGNFSSTVEETEKIYFDKIMLGKEDVSHMRLMYQAEVNYTDSLLKNIFSALEEHGKLSNTVVVFTSDHGEVLYEHEYYFGHSFSLYNQALNVPLIISYPGGIPAGMRMKNTVESIDIVPTVLDLLGIHPEAAAGFQGKNLVPMIMQPDKPFERPAFAERIHIGVGENGVVNQNGWKLIKSEDPTSSELYNLASDPLEQNNLYTTERERAQAMEAHLARFQKSQGAPAKRTVEIDEKTRKRLRALGYIQ